MEKQIDLIQHAIVDVEDAYDHMRHPPASDRDMVVRAINRATSKLESLCNRPIKQRTFDDRMNGSGSRGLWLRYYPVKAVSMIKWWDTSNTLGTSLDLTNLYIGDAGWISLSLDFVPSGFRNIQAQYTAGFSADDTPQEWETLRGYCLDLVLMYYQRWTSQRGEQKTVTAGTAGESFSDMDVPRYISDGVAADGLVRVDY